MTNQSHLIIEEDGSLNVNQNKKLGHIKFSIPIRDENSLSNSVDNEKGFILCDEGIKFFGGLEPNTESATELFELITSAVQNGVPIQFKLCDRVGDDVIFTSNIGFRYQVSISDLLKIFKEYNVNNLLTL